jgi:hypothetical protein
LIFSLISVKSQLGAYNNKSVSKGYGAKNDSLATLLDRIEWSNNYPGRINVAGRYGLYAVILSFFLSIIYLHDLDAQKLLQSILVIWVILMSSHNFFVHHSDKFCSYFTERNLNLIRKKLNKKSAIEKLSDINKKFARDSNCSTFIY